MSCAPVHSMFFTRHKISPLFWSSRNPCFPLTSTASSKEKPAALPAIIYLTKERLPVYFEIPPASKSLPHLEKNGSSRTENSSYPSGSCFQMTVFLFFCCFLVGFFCLFLGFFRFVFWAFWVCFVVGFFFLIFK